MATRLPNRWTCVSGLISKITVNLLPLPASLLVLCHLQVQFHWHLFRFQSLEAGNQVSWFDEADKKNKYLNNLHALASYTPATVHCKPEWDLLVFAL